LSQLSLKIVFVTVRSCSRPYNGLHAIVVSRPIFAIVSSSAKLYSVSAKELTRDVPDLTAQDRMEWPSSDIGFKG